MAYENIKSSDGTKTFTVNDAALDDSQLPIVLVGRRAIGYGEKTAQNFVHLLDNFCNAAPPEPTLPGTLWFDRANNVIKVNLAASLDDDADWVTVGPLEDVAGLTPGTFTKVTVNAKGLVTAGSNPNTLEALSNVSTLGILVMTDTTTAATRSIAGSAGRIVVSDGNGVAGNPTIDLATTGVTANSYTKVTVDIYGRVTTAENPTTLAGYGITDAYTMTAADGRFLRRDTTSVPTATNSFDLGSSSARWNNIWAGTFQGNATSANYADLAERYAADEAMEPGDVVALGGHAEITKTVGYMSPDVFGVVSASPAFRMNEGAGSDETHPYVALAGRVPCKVWGRVRKGQRLVASHLAGVAVAAEVSSELYPWSVFGRAVASKEDEGVGLVEAVVGVK